MSGTANSLQASAYHRWKRRLKQWARRAVGKNGPYLENLGHCATCDADVTFCSAEAWLRDHYRCTRCGSIPRERALMRCVEQFFPSWRGLSIHESSPGCSGASIKLAGQGKHYLATHYFPDVPPGQVHPKRNCRCENLERQTFADESFDLVISQDVMEHVLDPARAFCEIARTLKKGGGHVFTTPLVKKGEPSEVRARRDDDGGIVHLYPPEYHGNPVDPNGSLVTMHWGYDIADFILRHSGLYTTIVSIDDLSRGIRAEYNEVLVSRKL